MPSDKLIQSLFEQAENNNAIAQALLGVIYSQTIFSNKENEYITTFLQDLQQEQGAKSAKGQKDHASAISASDSASSDSGGKGSVESIDEAASVASNADEAASNVSEGIQISKGYSNLAEVTSVVRKTAKAMLDDIVQAYNRVDFEEGDDIFDVTSDSSVAIFWTSKAAEQGLPFAQLHLSQLSLLQDNPSRAEIKLAIEWAKKAAEQNYAPAFFDLAVVYIKGTSVTPNLKAAVQYLKQAAELGHSLSQHTLGEIYFFGQGVGRNYKKAAEWFELAAKQGYALSQYDLAMMYHKGEGLKIDKEKALFWAQKAADQGNTDAQKLLEELQGSNSNHDEHEQHNNKHAQRSESGARGKSGANDEQAVPQEKDPYSLTLEKITQDAENGNPQAQLTLSVLYTLGEYNGLPIKVEADPKLAFYWGLKAAEQGDAEAQANLAGLYYRGCGVRKSLKRCAYWLHQSAAKGYDLALYHLGLMYFYGEGGLMRDRRAAAILIAKAAELGYKEAESTLLEFGLFDCLE